MSAPAGAYQGKGRRREKKLDTAKIAGFLSYLQKKYEICTAIIKINSYTFIKITIMTKSALQIARAAYQPKLPKALTGAVVAKEGEPTQSVADQEEIKKLFPNTYGMPLIQFVEGEAKEFAPMNVGVILSGGQAPGGHNVISGLFDGIKKLNPANKLYGFILGPGGLVDHNYMELTADIIDEYRNTGGFDIIGSGRTKLEKEEQFEKGYEILKELGIKALVIIGGDDSNTNACVLAEYYAAKNYGVQVIGCPKTIDGDLKNDMIETSFGFDTACKLTQKKRMYHLNKPTKKRTTWNRNQNRPQPNSRHRPLRV
jgi:pyrophosphate--fructose-6-phosphate 1-phosphotransferase